jgi:Family of unknown function (DUF6064)
VRQPERVSSASSDALGHLALRIVARHRAGAQDFCAEPRLPITLTYAAGAFNRVDAQVVPVVGPPGVPRRLGQVVGSTAQERSAVGLPFTPDQFFGIFAEYNRTFLFVVVVLWVGSAGALAAAWRDPPRHSRALTLVLGVLWAWNAGAYHAYLFTRINPAAWLFAALFAIEAALLFRAGNRRPVEYFSAAGPMRMLGAGLAAYALAYPFLTLALGHSYPDAPTFGVPCPTTIMTIGVLMTARGGAPPILGIVPALWGFIGGSAAVTLNVPTDYVLLGAGALLTLLLVARVTRRGTGPTPG